MSETLGLMAAFILTGFLVFYLPVFLLSYEQDIKERERIEVQTEDFVDRVRTSGFITSEQLKDFCQGVSGGKICCNVEVTVYEAILYEDAKGNYKKEFHIISHDEILTKLVSKTEYPEPIFGLEKGDYINVKVTNILPGLTQRVIGIIGIPSLLMLEIAVSKGGMILYDNGFWRNDFDKTK